MNAAFTATRARAALVNDKAPYKNIDPEYIAAIAKIEQQLRADLAAEHLDAGTSQTVADRIYNLADQRRNTDSYGELEELYADYAKIANFVQNQ